MAESGVRTAAAIGEAARYDPQLRVPAVPRLRRDLHLHFGGTELVVDGIPKRQVIRGRSATELLPRMLELLDGTRSHEQLDEELGTAQGTAFKALSLLWTCGVIEDASPEGVVVPDGFPDRLADFLSRVGDITGANPSWEEAAQRLATARVELFGSGPFPGLIRAELPSVMGVALAEDTKPRADTDLAVWVDTGDEEEVEVVRHCWESRTPILRLRLQGRSARLGPYVDPRFTACLECRTAADTADTRVPGPGDHELFAALCANEIFALTSRATQGLLPLNWRTVDLETLGQRRRTAGTRPGCPRCSVAEGPQVPTSPAAHYEATVTLPPKEFADLKAHQAHYKPSNLAIQRLERGWPLSPEHPLPAPDPALLAHDWSPSAAEDPPTRGRLDETVLSILLSVVAGRQSEDAERVWRWTASGGNIGSVVAYPVVRDVPGVRRGVYGYVPSRNVLAHLSSAVDAVPGEAPLSLVLVGDVPKIARKYQVAALRLALLDSGCAQAATHHVARALDLRVTQHARWDDRAIAAALGVDLETEPLTAVFDLGGHA